MDEYDHGFDPEVKRYFRKIINSFSMGLLWLAGIATSGIYFQLGMVGNGIRWYHIAFYCFSLVTFLLLLRYYYRIWSKK